MTEEEEEDKEDPEWDAEVDQTTGNRTSKNQGMFHFKQVICGAASG